MGKLEEIVYPAAFAYSSAATGLLAALAVRAWFHHRGRVPDHVEAGVCVWLPPLAVLLLPLLAALPPQTNSHFSALHTAWHAWARVMLDRPTTHPILHVSNLVLLLVTAWGAARAIQGLARHNAFAKAIRAVAQPQPSPGVPVYVIPEERPLCFTMGIWRERVFVTTRLLAALGRRDLDVVLAHEAAHARRRDGLSGMVLVTFYMLFPLPASGLLWRDWERAMERACDLEAARSLGSPLDVAAALVRTVCLAQGERMPHPAARSFATSIEDIQGRVEALLTLAARGEPDHRHRGVACASLAAASLAFLAGIAFWVEHAVEFFARH